MHNAMTLPGTPEATVAEPDALRVGLIRLSTLVECLRETATFKDEEGDFTNDLDALLSHLRSHPAAADARDAAIVVDACLIDGMPPFISGAWGKVSINALVDMEKDLATELDEGLFTKGQGVYRLETHHEPGQYGEFGQCEFPPYWDFNEVSFEPLEPPAAMGAAPSADSGQPQQPEKDHLATPCGQAAPEIGAVPVQSPAAGVLTLSPSELPPEKIAEYLQLCDEVDALGILGAGVADAAPVGQAAQERGAEREPMTHTLKIDPIPFQAVKARIKKLELRKADRDFRVGDTLHLLETVSTGAEMAAGAPLEYTGGEDIVRVTHILHGPIYGLAEGWCVMSIEDAAPASVGQEPVALNIIRWWPDGFSGRLEHVWRDLLGFIPNYKLYDLQRMLAEFGFTMLVYEGPAPSTDALRQSHTELMEALERSSAEMRESIENEGRLASFAAAIAINDAALARAKEIQE
jgi:hypothetical protein